MALLKSMRIAGTFLIKENRSLRFWTLVGNRHGGIWANVLFFNSLAIKRPISTNKEDDKNNLIKFASKQTPTSCLQKLGLFKNENPKL